MPLAIRYDGLMTRAHSDGERSLAQESRVHDLEVRLAYQEHTMAQLDDVVRGFALRVERLERQLDELKDSMGSLEVGAGDEKPPHY